MTSVACKLILILFVAKLTPFDDLNSCNIACYTTDFVIWRQMGFVKFVAVT
jgi:hypothetical protein